MPTACELAGVTPPEGIDGISFLPTLLDKPQKGHDYLFWKYGGKEALRRGCWKAVRLKVNQPIALYNLQTDLGEQHDVAATHPDVVQQMDRLMKQAVRVRDER